MTRQGKGGTALGITMMASFFAASVGIVVMFFMSPLLVQVAFEFGPANPAHGKVRMRDMRPS